MLNLAEPKKVESVRLPRQITKREYRKVINKICRKRLIKRDVLRKAIGLIYKTTALATSKNYLDHFKTLTYRSDETIEHSLSTLIYGACLISACNYSEQEQIDVALGLLFHDIGKSGIEKKILHKAGKLDDNEMMQIQSHPLQGYLMMQETFKDRPLALDTILYHHENYGGNGYPERFDGDNIPCCARIAKVVDVYEARTAQRVYAKAEPHYSVIDDMLKDERNEFDPAIIRVFSQIFNPSLIERPDDRKKNYEVA